MATGRLLSIAILAVIMLGCAHMHGNPMIPSDSPTAGMSAQSAAQNDSHRLWQDGTFFFNGTHDRVDVVPHREARFHLNTLKFLEEYCSDCVQIKNIKNNGDDTIDLTVKITHPFPGFPEYTGFDVKGILMFTGSMLLGDPDDPAYVLDMEYYGMPLDTRISWRELGDPEVLNADGYTPRWNPRYDSGQTAPIFNYWKGKYSSGEPNSDINAYLDFYTAPERHMFETNSSVERTYTIYLPPGEPVVAGYAVEACWEPPTVTPVTDPLNDFPTSANQPEAYHFRVIVNNGDPIVQGSQCCIASQQDCSVFRAELNFWGDVGPDDYPDFYLSGYWAGIGGGMGSVGTCDAPYEGFAFSSGFSGSLGGLGIHRDVYILCHPDGSPSQVPPSRVSWWMCDRLVVQ